MPYIIRGYFRQEVEQKRLRLRPAHIRHVISRLPDIVCAGALCGEDRRPQGLFLAVNCVDRDQAESLLAADPYYQEGLFERVEIEHFIQFAPHENPRILHEELERALQSASACAN